MLAFRPAWKMLHVVCRIWLQTLYLTQARWKSKWKLSPKALLALAFRSHLQSRGDSLRRQGRSGWPEHCLAPLGPLPRWDDHVWSGAPPCATGHRSEQNLGEGKRSNKLKMKKEKCLQIGDKELVFFTEVTSLAEYWRSGQEQQISTGVKKKIKIKIAAGQ